MVIWLAFKSNFHPTNIYLDLNAGHLFFKVLKEYLLRNSDATNPWCCCFIPATDKGFRGPLQTVIDSHVKLQGASLVVWLAVIFPESGASIPLFPSPNLTVLKHPCALGAQQKPNAANAKLINRTPAAWASERHTIPRRKYSALYVSIVAVMLWCQWDITLIGLLICFVNFVYGAIAFQKILGLISVPQLLGLPCAVRSEKKLVLPHRWRTFTQHTDSSRIQWSPVRVLRVRF